MATEMQPDFDVELFALRSSEVAGILEAGRLEPIQGSPLLGLSVEVDDPAREMARQASKGIQAAARRIAAPDRVIGLVTASPPDPPDFLWLYGARSDLDFAYHQEEETGLHRLAWPVDGVTVLDLAAAPLGLYGSVEHFGVSLALGREEFSALAAIADFVQADALQGVLHHDPPVPEPPTFLLEDLVTLADRATQSGDLRWMVSRARLLSPIELDFGEGVLGTAAESLLESGLLQEANGLYEITPLLHKVCLLVGTCTGLSALSTRNRDEETGGWALDHFALTRGPGVLFLFEFEDVTSTDFLVSIDDITPPLAFEWLQGGLLFEDEAEDLAEEEADFRDAVEPGSPMPAATLDFDSGSPAHAEPAGPEGGQQRFCTNCGIPVDAGKGFCTQCGERMMVGGDDA